MPRWKHNVNYLSLDLFLFVSQRMRRFLFSQTSCSLLRRQRRPKDLPHHWFLSSASFSTADYDDGDAFQSSPSKVKIFDRHLKRRQVGSIVFLFSYLYESTNCWLINKWWLIFERQRDRAAWLLRPNDSFVHAVAENLVDRLEVVIWFALLTILFHK